MEKAIILKYGELWLKSERTKKRFLHALKEHLLYIFPRSSFTFLRDRVVVKNNLPELNKFKYIPGISYAHKAYVGKFKDIGFIAERCVEILKKENISFSSFAVRCSRRGKHDFRSKDVEIVVGERIKNEFNAQVNLSHPEFTLKIEILDQEFYVVVSSVRCLGGLPYASEGCCEVNQPNNYFLILELLKRGIYVYNIPSTLRDLFPERKLSLPFKVLVYDYASEEIEKIKTLEKPKESLMLFPFVTMNKEEIKKKNKYIKEDINNIYGITL